MKKHRTWAVCCLAAISLVAGVVQGTPAQALSTGLAFSAESLPTWQANEVARAVTTSQGMVVIGGAFTELRPPNGEAGAPLSTPGLAILDADSGQPATCQLPAAQTDGTPTIWALNTSPDGKTVYVGGAFTSIGNVAVDRVAAIDVASCSVKPLRVPGLTASVYGLASTDTTLYLAGAFVEAAGQPRARFAAVNAETGALLPWVADADLPGRAIAVSPDGSKVAIGGDFFAVNGSYSHSIAVVDGVTGVNLRTYPEGFVNDLSVTKAIVSDGKSFYVGNEGNGSYMFDGRIALDWDTLNERWRDTCLGATQALLLYQGILYSGSHSHDCSGIGYYQNGGRHYFVAETTQDHTFRGWNPTANDGIGEGIGPRGLAMAVGTSGANYLYAVGEFTQINGQPQQSITRFGTKDTGAPPTPYIQAEALSSAAVQVRVWTVVDNDDDTLTYSIYRDGATTPIWSGKATSWWWSRPQITFTDRTAKVDQTHSYKVKVSDGTNTSALSSAASAKPVTKATDYPAQVIADGAALYWRFDETSGTWTWNKGVDSTSGMGGLMVGKPGLGATGALPSGHSATFDGVDDYAWNDQLRAAPNLYTVETWIKTTTQVGGKIIGYTNNRPRTDNGAPLWATKYDRQVYMDNAGRLNFGAVPGAVVTVRSPKSYNDGAWHHVVAAQGPSGMTLRVDGLTVARNTESGASAYAGVWRVGGDTIAGWPNRPKSDFFAGQIDETAVYEGKVLSDSAVVKHYTLSGRKVVGNSLPADSFGAAVYQSAPLFYWPLNEASGAVLDRSQSGSRPGNVGSGIQRRVAGVVGDKLGIETAGKSGSAVVTKTQQPSPTAFSTEVWVKTKSTQGGKLIGFENYQTATSNIYDKHLYLTNDGTIVFGVQTSSLVTVRSGKGLNDGRWHHVVGTQGSSGLVLYVDGVKVASNATTTSRKFSGYWRLGGGNLAGWPSRPTSGYLAGTLDDTAVYDRALTASEVAQHYAAR